jgi:LuxR family maltose regulon positive regulatory protein
LVQRPALIQHITQGLEGYLTLISAPAGFGKTTLVAAWAAQSTRRVAWLSLDEADNELDVFLVYVVAAIRTLFPEACPDLTDLVQRGPLPESNVLSSILINEIDDVSDRFVLVLDDYQHITNPVIHALLDALLRHPPLQMHLLITSRLDPPLALNRLRSNGMLSEVRTGDLSFSLLETEIFLAQSIGVDYSEEAAAVLQPRAEGWIAGLQLAAVSLRAASNKTALLHEMAQGQNRQIMNYLFEQVLQRQTPSVRDFLVKTSIVERFSPALAQAIIDSELDAAVAVTPQTLEQAGLMLSALDSSGEWYAYHTLFRDLLRQTLHATCPSQDIALLHHRAANWLSQQGLIEEALHQALAAHDTDLATRFVSANWIEQLNREDWRTIERWLSLLPDEVIQTQIWLLIAKASVFQAQYRWNAIAPVVERAEQLLAEVSATLSGADRSLVRGYLDWFWTFHWLLEGEAERVKEVAQQALLNLPLTHYFAAGSVLTMLSAALQWLGEFEIAQQRLNSMLALTPASPSQPDLLVRPLYALMSLQLAEGYLDSSAQTAQTLLQTSVAVKATTTQAWAELALGVIAYELDDLELAARHFRAGVELRYACNVRTAQECLTGLALTCQAQGRSDEAQGVAALMLDYHRDRMNLSLSADSQSLRAHLALLNGDVATARRLLDPAASERGLMFGWLEIASLTRIRLELADPNGNLHNAWQEAERLLELVQRLRQPRRQVELLALKAAVCDRAGDRLEALQDLRAALALAEPRGFIRSIVDAGPAILPLLKAVAQGGPTPYVTQLLNALQSTNTTPDEPEVQLTRRERELLKLLGQRQTDREIAVALFVSPNTVRTHIDHISKKLGVRGRRAVVTRAQELGFLT